MTKEDKLYYEKFGHIPEDLSDRISYILSTKKKLKGKVDIMPEVDRINNIKWHDIEFTVYLLPKATPRPRTNYNRKIFYVSGASNNKHKFEKIMKEMNVNVIDTPMIVDIRCYFPTPSGMNIKEKLLAEFGFIRPITKPDWDNVAKTYCDALQSSLMKDDSLIIDGRCRKFYSVKPRIEMKISYMEEHDSLFNAKKFI